MVTSIEIGCWLCFFGMFYHACYSCVAYKDMVAHYSSWCLRCTAFHIAGVNIDCFPIWAVFADTHAFCLFLLSFTRGNGAIEPSPFPLVHPLYHGFAIALNINLCQRALGRSSRLCPRTQIQYAAPPCAAVIILNYMFNIIFMYFTYFSSNTLIYLMAIIIRFIITYILNFF